MASKTSIYLFAFIMVTSLIATVVFAEGDEDVDVVLGPEGQIIFKESKKGKKGDSIVIARRRRSLTGRKFYSVQPQEFPDYD